ncbi:MAG: phosphoribosylamine--glycine ligase [Gemmatimonadales bacterium]
MQKILVVGGGGREHALCWAIRREAPAARIWCAPGNAGTESLATNLPIAADSLDALVGFADQEGVDLTVIGPEAPLALGLADRVRARGRLVFGPSRAAARIEASKAWSKSVMEDAGVPTARSATFEALAPALAYVDRHAEPLVVKASGLAAGKGAVVCPTRAEARDAVRAMLAEGQFGEAGNTVVIEDFLEGEELSILALTDGREVRLLPAAQDHKRLLEGDQGPNTGGMGAYSPVALETEALLERVMEQVIEPTLAELECREARFAGVLYAGLMIDALGNPSVVEFNCRFGDPEAQAIIPRVSGGLLDAMTAVAQGTAIPPVSISTRAAVTTVLAARGYPDRPEKGASIEIPEDLGPDTIVFHAGTTRDADGRVRVSGGRVLAVTGLGASFAAARESSASAAGRIQFDGKQYRRDIGWRESARV